MSQRITILVLFALQALSAATIANLEISGGKGVLEPFNYFLGPSAKVSGPGFTASIGGEGGPNDGFNYDSPLPATTNLNSSSSFTAPWDCCNSGHGTFSSSLPNLAGLFVLSGSAEFATPYFDIIPGRTEYRVPFEATIRLGVSKSEEHMIIDPRTGELVENIPDEIILRGAGFAIPEVEFIPLSDPGAVGYIIPSVQYQFVAIPEPGSLTLGLGGLATLACMKLRRRRIPFL